MNRTILIIALVAILGLGAAYFVLSGGSLSATEATEQATETASEETSSADLPAITEMTMGDVNAPVKVIEYASYTCSHCGDFHNESLKDLKANYIDTGKVHFTYREVYFDRAALWASMVARCGGDEKFFGISNLIYKGQRDWMGSGDPVQMADGLRKIARVAGLSSETIDACLEDQDKAQALAEWFQANAEADGIESTPSFIIGDDRVIGNNYAKLREVIDAQLEN
ncbi:thioredoxin domain-containing protein [Lentibacter sp. XHP0401]|jgi:protein-disulfide isomerase|uniref:thioredoxin domain-containing protein n=1 Tax=Lentibacter sp. XHP0401 TaxID=2984334 RepID=UPI0021E798C6|nr:thioredoxin domain-containing protein [Lentibacter sp. XHP0401]MCV2892696.1 thioredoxin domain-containing protein [Lentibacter sp. XHP0401]